MPIKFLFRNTLWGPWLELRRLYPMHSPQKREKTQFYICFLTKSYGLDTLGVINWPRAKRYQINSHLCSSVSLPFFQETELSLPLGWSPHPGFSLRAIQDPALPSSKEAPHVPHVSQSLPDVCFSVKCPECATKHWLLEFPRDFGFLGQFFSSRGGPALAPVSSAHLDHAEEGLFVFGPEYLPDVKHVQLTTGDHDADQGVVPSPQALGDK